MPSKSRENARSTDGSSDVDRERTGDQSSTITSLLIVILSLVFVVIFGGSLIGGILSGDPSNVFFITIVAASAFAISVALGVSVRYVLTQRSKRQQAEHGDDYFAKDNHVRETFSGSSDEENHLCANNRPSDYDPRDGHYPPIESEIKEIEAKSVFGEMSALSPTTYDGGSLSTYRHHIIRDNHRRGFDFSSITSAKHGDNASGRQDPPEGTGLATIQAAWNTRAVSREPSAPKFSTEGETIADNDYSKDANDDCDEKSSRSRKSARSRGDLEEKSVRTERSKYSQRTKSSSKSRSRSKSPSNLRNGKSPANSEANSFFSSGRKEKEATVHPVPPMSTRSGATSSVKPSAVPSTPAASEAGSFASSFMGLFAKGKKTASEAGSTSMSSSDKSKTEPKEKVPDGKKKDRKPPMVRPPMMPSNKKGGDGLQSVGLTGPSVSTPSNNSTFTIPPPRVVPRTPAGGDGFSEFQSVVESTYSNGVASSTFDPQARERALQKLRRNQAAIGAAPIGAGPLGATPVDAGDMPIYYTDDDDKASSVGGNSAAQLNSYDVFAPPGALGIVVDTTDKGCIVYSLKKSSPMLGLMHKGHLIIGLDNFDVRNMTASSLTKLMAKKSDQQERKFTLVPNN